MSQKDSTTVLSVVHPQCCGLDVHKDKVSAAMLLTLSDGTVSECDVSAGEWVATGDEVLRIIETDRVTALLWVSADQLAYIAEGSVVRVRQEWAADAWQKGTVLRISQQPEPRTGRYTADVRLANPLNRFQPGRFVDARLMLESE